MEKIFRFALTTVLVIGLILSSMVFASAATVNVSSNSQSDLQAAINNAGSGDTINFTGNISTSSNLKIAGKTITFTGNGTYTYTGSSDAISINSGSNVTFNGPSFINAGSKEENGTGFIWLNNATVTVRSGLIKGYWGYTDGSNATVNIQGGTLQQYKHQLICAWRNGIVINISGGTLEGNDLDQPLLWCNPDQGNTTTKINITGGTLTKPATATGSQSHILLIGTVQGGINIGNADGTGPTMIHKGSANIFSFQREARANYGMNIKGGTFTHEGSGDIIAFNSGYAYNSTVNITGGNFNHTGSNGSIIDTSARALGASAKFNISGGNFTSSGGKSGATGAMFYINNDLPSDTQIFTFSDGTYTNNTASAATLYTNDADIKSNFVISGGEWTSSDTHSGAIIHFNSGPCSPASFIISGGTWSKADGNIVYIDAGNVYDFQITGGTFNASSTANVLQKNNGTATITGGNFNHTGGGNIFYGANKDTGPLTINNTSNKIEITHSGTGPVLYNLGSFAVNITNLNVDRAGAGPVLSLGNSSGTVTVTNSNLKAAVSAVVLANTAGTIEFVGSNALESTGTKALDRGDGTYTVVPSTAGSTYTEADETNVVVTKSLQDLIDATPENGTLTLESDFFNEATQIDITKNITITGESKNIIFADQGFFVAGGAKLTLNGSLVVSMTGEDTDFKGIVFVDDGSLEINSGTFTGFIGAGYNTVNIVINGGTFYQHKHQVIVGFGSASVTINGGTFIGNNVNKPMMWIDEGADVKILGGTWSKSGASYDWQGSNTSDSNRSEIFLVGSGAFQIGAENTEGPSFNLTGTGSVICYQRAFKSAYTHNIYSGKFSHTGTKGHIIYLHPNAEFSGNLNIKGGEFTQACSNQMFYINQTVGGKINISGGTFTRSSRGTFINFNKGNKVTTSNDVEIITGSTVISGGTWNGSAAGGDGFVVDDSYVKNFEISDGIFNFSASDVIYKHNGNATISGGTFNYTGTGTVVNTKSSKDNGEVTIKGGTYNHSGSGSIFKLQSKSPLNISNTTINRENSGLIIEAVTVGGVAVNITDSSLTANNTAIKLGSGYYTTNVGTLTLTNSTIKSNTARAIDNRWGIALGQKDNNYYDNIVGKEQIVDAPTVKTNGQPKMLRFAGNNGGSGKTIAVSTESKVLSGDYTLTLNYRETGGAVPYVTIKVGDTTTQITAENAETFEGGRIVYNFTVASAGRVKVSLGRDGMHHAGAVYFGNISIKDSIGGENMIAFDSDAKRGNADLSISYMDSITDVNAASIIPGWTLESDASKFASVRVMELPNEYFTKGNPKAANYVYKFEDGKYTGFSMRFHMKEDTSYEFSYNYMSTGVLPATIRKPNMDRPFQMEYVENNDEYKTTVIFTLGNDGDDIVEYEGSTIVITGDRDGDGSFKYIGNIEMYEVDINGNRITGRNLMADFNPLYAEETTFASLPSTDDGSKAASGLVAGYGIRFENANANTASIVRVPAEFFHKISFKDRRTGVRRHLIETEEGQRDIVYDYSADTVVNVIDLLRIKKYEEGYVGADFESAVLKNEILNAANTTPTYASKVIRVAKGQNLTTALSQASSGYTVLLERGGEWRIPKGSNGSAWTIPSGVTLGAYGDQSLPKPVLNGSVSNYSDISWSNQGGNIWKVKVQGGTDAANLPGTVYFYSKLNDEKPALIGTILKNGKVFASTSELTTEGDVYSKHDASSNWWDSIFGGGSTNDIYVYCVGNPANKYERIEIGEQKDVLYAESKSNIKIDNITIKHAGGHGINMKKCSNVTISNCEIGYVGGSPSGNSAIGNGIQFGVSGTNLIAEHNYIYQCYDAGITPQSWVTSSTNNFTNVEINNNLLESNFYNVEFWNDNGSMQIKLNDNIFKDAGYVWSFEQRYTTGNHKMFASHIYAGRDSYNTSLNIAVNNNIFNNTKSNIFCWFWGGRDDAASLPAKYANMTFSGNSYYQKVGSYDSGQIMYYGKTSDRTYATGQESLEKAVALLDSNPTKVVFLEQWLTDQVAAGDSFGSPNVNYSDVTVNGEDISKYVIINETSSKVVTYSVRSAIKQISGKTLKVTSNTPADNKAVKIVTTTSVAPNTVKVYVENNTLYIAAYDVAFIDEAATEFEKLLAGGVHEFADGYEKVVTLPTISYQEATGTLKLIGDATKNPVGYSVGETAKVNVSAYANGNILSVPYFHVTTYNESTGGSTDEYVSGASGVCELNLTSSTEGFVYWTVVACDSSKNKISTFAEVDSNIHYAGSVGFNVKNIAKSSNKPADFDSNWAAAATEVASTSATASTMEEVSAKDGYKAYRVVINYANAGGFVTGYLTYPTNATAGSLGLMLRFQSNSISAPAKYYQENTAIFSVCAHSLDLTKTGDSTYMSNFKSSINKGGNNFAWDNQSFSTSYLVKMVKRDLLAGKFMMEYFTANGLWNGTAFTAKGTSMGGFQSIAVAALLDDVTGRMVTTLDVSLPWLCDLGAETNNRKDSSWRPTYAYADNVHFATMLSNINEIIVNAGLGDAICPASGVMAFYNTINNYNKSITFRQNNTHSGGYDGAYYTIEN